MQSLQHIQVKLLIYCYFLEVQTLINIKKEINIVLTLEWTCRALFWSGRIWWLPLTCLLLWLRVVAIAPTLITSYNFREKLMVIFELFLQIMANIHTLFFLAPLRADAAKNYAATCIIIKSVKMHWHEFHDTPVMSEISSLVRQWSAWTAWRTFATFSSVLLVEGRPWCSWSSADISPISKWLTHSYACVLPMALSIEASLSIVTVSSALFPERKPNFTHAVHDQPFKL